MLVNVVIGYDFFERMPLRLQQQQFSAGKFLSLGLIASVVCLACFYIRLKRKQIHDIPYVGRKTDSDFREALHEGRTLYPGKAFALLSEPLIVILPQRLIDTLKCAPETLVSADKEVRRRGLGQYTDLGVPMPEMFNAIKVNLTRHIRDFLPPLQQEVSHVFEKNLQFDEGEMWKQVTAFELVKRIVTFMNSIAFVGIDLARDREWQEVAYNYSSELRKAFDALQKWPFWLRPFVHQFIFNRIGFSATRRRVAAMLQHLVTGTKPTAGCTLTTFIRQRLGPPRCDDENLLARILLRVVLASSDTVAQALTNALYDIASTSGCAEVLREEASSALSESNGVWDMDMLRKLTKLDSLLRESARTYAPFLVAMGRMTTSPMCLENGQIIPEETTVYFDMYGAHRSLNEELAEDMEKFDPFRFSKMREVEAAPNKYFAATTGPNNLPFGHGSHSCPGRFWAVAVMKVILVHMLLNYDIRLEPEKRPQTRYRGIAVLMDRNATLYIRRRQDSDE